MLFGIVQRLKPDLVIAIDALAARSLHRLNTTIQISDTGIYPGSGVGSRGQGITPQTLGIPVLAIGVPTVVDAATLANDVLELVVKAVHKQAGVGSDVSQLLSLFEELESTDKKQLIREVLNPEVGMLMVTPKEVDRLLNDISGVLANGLNAALHPRVAAEFFH